MKVYILFFVANDYNQPDKAFEQLYWEKPTFEELSKYGFTREDYENNAYRDSSVRYWVECFEK